MKLKDKVAMITGGGSGIGEATVLEFANEGAKEAVCDINEEGATAVTEKCKASGHDAEAFHLDVSNKQNVDSVVKAIVERFGRLDILIDNAGITKDSFAIKMTLASLPRINGSSATFPRILIPYHLALFSA